MLALLTGVHGLVALGTSRTLFQPDEFWQSLEVAHKIVFGYGYLTWEWASAQPIRSIAHPAMFVPLYYTLRMLGLDHVSFLMVGMNVHLLTSCLDDSSTASTSIAHCGGRLVCLPTRCQDVRETHGIGLGTYPLSYKRSLCIYHRCSGYLQRRGHLPTRRKPH